MDRRLSGGIGDSSVTVDFLGVLVLSGLLLAAPAAQGLPVVGHGTPEHDELLGVDVVSQEAQGVAVPGGVELVVGEPVVELSEEALEALTVEDLLDLVDRHAAELTH